VITDHQSAGRGRLNRQWVTRPGESLAFSLIVPGGATANQDQAAGWLPLVAGAALVGALRANGILKAELKWPNDVLVSEMKLAGILCEVLPGSRVVVGVGLNIDFSPEDPPGPRATALSHHGSASSEAVDTLLADFVGGMRRWCSVAPQMQAQSAHQMVMGVLATIGRTVEVHDVSRTHWRGTAVSLNESGHLLVVPEGSSEPIVVGSSDIWHLYQ